ncbi:hypothetical protein ACC786_14310 [Rhizobium ruizarguesonis]|uniref:hypothetical protein n=1 Tax=Rhizobium ruizarguesonis TaxID=2081791 RepID=UPI0013EE75CB|nr:hypothetical protein [Rhizobium ruizarguesonis]
MAEIVNIAAFLLELRRRCVEQLEVRGPVLHFRTRLLDSTVFHFTRQVEVGGDVLRVGRSKGAEAIFDQVCMRLACRNRAWRASGLVVGTGNHILIPSLFEGWLEELRSAHNTTRKKSSTVGINSAGYRNPALP